MSPTNSFQFKTFQREDLARAALHDGLILAWDTGLGKTLGLFTFPLLKAGWRPVQGRVVPHGPCLVIAPGDLHAQIAREAATLLRIDCVPLASQEDYYRLIAGTPQRPGQAPRLPDGFYLTSYTQLTGNGVRPFPPPPSSPRRKSNASAVNSPWPNGSPPSASTSFSWMIGSKPAPCGIKAITPGSAPIRTPPP